MFSAEEVYYDNILLLTSIFSNFDFTKFSV